MGERFHAFALDNDWRKNGHHLTDKGLDLAPVLIDLVAWSAIHERTTASPKIVKRIREDREAYLQEIVAAARARAAS